MAKTYARPNANKRTLPNVLNKKQLIALFEKIDDAPVFMGFLVALLPSCLVALLPCFCGLRINEVCNLKKQDVDLEAKISNY